MIKKILIIILSLLITINVIFIIFIEIYKNDLIDLFKKNLNTTSVFQINYSKVDVNPWRFFPTFSIVVKDPSVSFGKNAVKTNLLQAKELSVKLRLRLFFPNKLVFKSLTISDGYLYTDENFWDWIYNSTSSDDKPTTAEINNLHLKNIRVEYQSSPSFGLTFYLEEGNISGFLGTDKSTFRFDALSDSIEYNHKGVTGLDRKIKFAGILEVDKEFLAVRNLAINYLGDLFAGNIKYNFSNDSFEALIKTDRIKLNKHNLLIKKLFDIEVEKGLADLNFIYSTNFTGPSKDKMITDFKIKNALIKVGGFENVSVSSLIGRFDFNKSLSKSKISVNKLELFTEGASINGSLRVINLAQPNCLFEGSFTVPQSLMQKYSSNYSFDLNGHIKTIVKLERIKKPFVFKVLKIKSTASIKNAQFGTFRQLKSFGADLNINDNLIDGKFDGIIRESVVSGRFVVYNLLETINDSLSAKIDLSFNTDFLDLQDFSSVKQAETSSTKHIGNKPLLTINAKINTLKFKELTLEDASFRANYINNDLFVNSLIFNAFGGSFNGSASITNSSTIQINGKIGQMNFKELSSQVQSKMNFENHGAKIEGRFSSTLNVRFNYDSLVAGNFSGLSVESFIDIEDGKIFNVKQFGKIAGLIKLKEVENLEFNHLSNRIYISNNLITIPEMEINNNILNIKVSGNYNIKGNYSFYLNFKMSELLSKNYPKNNAVNTYYYDDNRRVNIFLKVTGDQKDYKIEYDTKRAFNSFKNNVIEDSKLLKQTILSDFSTKKDSSARKNNIDTLGNKSNKTTFNIEWEEFDTIKIK